MASKNIQRKADALKQLGNKARGRNRAKTDDIVELYSNRTI